ncbi:hypothetical protein NMY22_g9323 [Coprinellus aureogranulatus]|nr:hypothetical protein NMY22_g9323 [Coprinellus aureogranulatus]
MYSLNLDASLVILRNTFHSAFTFLLFRLLHPEAIGPPSSPGKGTTRRCTAAELRHLRSFVDVSCLINAPLCYFVGSFVSCSVGAFLAHSLLVPNTLPPRVSGDMSVLYRHSTFGGFWVGTLGLPIDVRLCPSPVGLLFDMRG